MCERRRGEEGEPERERERAVTVKGSARGSVNRGCNYATAVDVEADL